MKRLIQILALCAAALGPAAAEFRPQATFPPGSVPEGLNVQGSLEEQDKLVDGTRTMGFRLYDAATGGNLLWNGGTRLITVDEGIWGTRLQVPLAALLLPGDKYVEVDVSALVLGRQKLTAVPYARIAESLAGSIEISEGGFSISTSATAGAALYVSSLSLGVGIGTSTILAADGLRVLGNALAEDVRIGTVTTTGGSTFNDLYVRGNMAVGGAFAAGSGNRFELLSVSTEIAAATPFLIAAGTFAAYGGRVGIGTTQPSAQLDVRLQSTAGMIVGHPSNPRIDLNRAGTTRLRWEHAAAGRLGTVTADPLAISRNGAALYIEAGGDVGIGTTNPARLLDAPGVARGAVLESSGTGTAGAPSIFIGADADTGLFLQAEDSLGFATGAAERMRINASGDMSAGTLLPAAGTRLRVSGGDMVLGAPVTAGAGANPDLRIEGNLKVDGTQSLAGLSTLGSASVSTTIASGQLFNVLEGTFTVRESGLVGIHTGSAQPSFSLHINAATNPGLALDHATNPRLRLRRAGSDRIRLEHDGTIGAAGTDNASDFRLQTGGNPRLTLELGGDVGIGTTNPAALLDVTGAVVIEGALTLGTPLAVASGGTAGTDGATARTGLSATARDGSDATANSLWPIRISSTAAEATTLEYDPPDCAGLGIFPKGFSDKLHGENCLDATGSLDLTEATSEARFYDTDNDLAVRSSSWTVLSSGAFDIEFDSADDTFFIDVSADNVGVGLTNPGSKLEVSGDINASAKMSEAGVALIPAGAVIFSTWVSGCPAGWSELVAARGRIIVGKPSGSGTLGGTVGTALTNLAQLNHAHDLSAHTHSVDPDGGGHTHGLNAHTHDTDPDGAGHTHGLNAHTHSVDPDGAGHIHDLSNHTHNWDFPNTTSGAPNNGAIVLQGGGASTAADGTLVVGHTHDADPASTASTVPSDNNSGTNDLGSVASGTPSTANTTSTDLGSVTSSVPSQANTTSTNLGSAASGAPSTDSTDTLAVTLPYLQLRVCEKT